ncbi:Piwi-like protein 1 [Orchesella cincta]|uniref:Piwi-like protein 1 n=1 Tax=Orchesella cincta TaxID=48709 RepID=A0A1D2N4E2_ORCCI|nr:Piwi-like protein 1 [Orchesella cincta]
MSLNGSSMSNLGRGRGRGRPPTSLIQEGDQRSPAAVVEANPTEDVAAVVVPPVPRRQGVTMQDLVERYADPDQPEELQALREMAIMQIASPASPEGPTPKDMSNRGRFRGRGVVSAVNIPAIDVGGGHGQPIAIATPSRPRSPPLPLALNLMSLDQAAVAPSANDHLVLEPPVVAPVVQPQPDDAEIANRAVETAVSVKPPPVELPIISRVGTKGARLDVATNYIRLKLATGRPGIVEYHVSYSVPIESVAIRRKALKQFEHRLGLVKSFDGMILFLPYILDDDVTVLHGVHPIDANLELTAHVTFVKVKPMKEAIPFFNILLRRIMIELGFVEIRREFYDLELAQFLKAQVNHSTLNFLYPWLEIWPGFNPVAENQEDGLMINVDACSRVLRMDTVYDYYLMVKGDPKGKTKFNEFVVNKIVITKYNHVTYRVDDVAWDMTPMTEFERKGQTVRYNPANAFSKLKPRKNDRLTQSDTTQRVAALVPECCHMTGLTEDQRNNFKVMTDLAGSTRLTPQQRVEGLKRFIDRLMSELKFLFFCKNHNLMISLAALL